MGWQMPNSNGRRRGRWAGKRQTVTVEGAADGLDAGVVKVMLLAMEM
jgi:hypothetical protein